jgi:hypothetical protein
VAKLPCVLSYEKTSPPLAVLGPPCAMARSKANANLPTLSPLLDDTLGPRARRPSRAWATPAAVQAAVPGGLASALRPPPEPRIGPPRRPHNGSRTVGKKPQTLQQTVRALPHQLLVVLGRTLSGPNYEYLMLPQEVPPEVDWFISMKGRGD